MVPITRQSIAEGRANPIEQSAPPRSPREMLPTTMYDLPSEDLEEPGWPEEFHAP